MIELVAKGLATLEVWQLYFMLHKLF